MKKIHNFFIPLLATISLSSCGKINVFEPSFKKYGNEVDNNFFSSQLTILANNISNTYFKDSNIYFHYMFANCKSIEINLKVSNLYEKDEVPNESRKAFYYSEKSSHLIFDSTNGRFKHNSIGKLYSDSDYDTSYGSSYNSMVIKKGKTTSVNEENYYGEIVSSRVFIADINRSIVHAYYSSQSNIYPIYEYANYFYNSLSNYSTVYGYDKISYYSGDSALTKISSVTSDHLSAKQIIQAIYGEEFVFKFKDEIYGMGYHTVQCYELSLRLYSEFVKQIDYSNYQFVFNHMSN